MDSCLVEEFDTFRSGDKNEMVLEPDEPEQPKHDIFQTTL